MSDTQTTATALPFVVRADGARELYRLAVDHGPYANWPVASMIVCKDCTYVALSRSFNAGDAFSVTLRYQADARELCEAHATLMAQLAEVTA